MAYELRLNSTTVLTFESEEEAVGRARQEIRSNPALEPELRDMTTGKPVAPGASKGWRDDLGNKVGY
jgi:hypothetical protein